VYAAEVATVAGEVRVGQRRALFRDGYRTGGAGNHAGWDVAPGGQRFVFVLETGVASERRLNVLVNWFDQPRAAPMSRRD
jgi:hypothetical protein